MITKAHRQHDAPGLDASRRAYRSSPKQRILPVDSSMDAARRTVANSVQSQRLADLGVPG
jgi:hypothetical protein